MVDEQLHLKQILIRKENRIQRASYLLHKLQENLALNESLKEETRELLHNEIVAILPYLENDDKEENKYNYDNANGYKMEQSHLQLRQLIRRKAKRIERAYPLINRLRAKVVLNESLIEESTKLLLDEISTIVPYLTNDDKEDNKYNSDNAI